MTLRNLIGRSDKENVINTIRFCFTSDVTVKKVVLDWNANLNAVLADRTPTGRTT